MKLAQLKQDIADMESVYNDSTTPANIKESIGPALKKARAQLAEADKGSHSSGKSAHVKKAPATKGKSTTPREKSTRPKATVSSAMKLAQKYRKEQGLSTKKSDIERDAKRSSKPAGKRVSESGNVYYENRENRTDRLAKKYPKLAKGGEVNMNKDWKVIYITTDGAKGEKIITLGEVNEDLKRAIKKMKGPSDVGNIKEVLSITPVHEDGGMLGDATYNFRFDITSPAFEKGGMIPDWLFIGTYPAARVYADRRKESRGEYHRIGTVTYSPLRLNVTDNNPKYAHVIELMKEDMEQMRKDGYVETSSTGQTAKVTEVPEIKINLDSLKYEKGGMIAHGFHSGDVIYEIYKGYGIIEQLDGNKTLGNGMVVVVNPNHGTRYVVGLDDSKSSGKRIYNEMPFKEAVQEARNYIDYLTDGNGRDLVEMQETEHFSDNTHDTKPVYKDGGKVDADNIIGTTLYANTGVPLKVIDYDSRFGGRVKVSRNDELYDGTVSQWMPIKKFTTDKPKFEHGGKTSGQEKFETSIKAVKNQINMVQLQDGTLIRGSELKFADGGSLTSRTTVEVGEEPITVIIKKKETTGYPVYIRTVGYAPITHNLYPTKEKALSSAKSLANKNGYAFKFADGGVTGKSGSKFKAQVYDSVENKKLLHTYYADSENAINEAVGDIDAYVKFYEKRKGKYNNYGIQLYKKGGSTFADKVSAIADKLSGTTVAAKYKKKYGSKYSPAEAKEAATKIVGKMVSKSGEMVKKGGRKVKKVMSKTGKALTGKYGTKK